MQFKAVLYEFLQNNDSVLELISMDWLLEEMMNNIGSTDAELRDTLIYNAFGKLILEDHLHEDQWIHIAKTCLDKNHLFLNIGETSTDSVFSRSFSALVLALILEKDSQELRIPDKEIRLIIEKSIIYLEAESDIRGYVKGKGWAHSIAHGADLLAEAVKHPHFSKKLIDPCLQAVKHTLFKKSEDGLPYLDDEEERLVFVMEALMAQGLTEKRIAFFVSELSSTLTDLMNREGMSLFFFRKRGEIIRFLRVIYFRCLFNENYPMVQQKLLDELKAWHKALY